MFGNTHFNIGKKIAENIEIHLSEEEKIAFLSGMVYADIGRIKFDKLIAVASDSQKFISQMKKYAQNKQELWFIKGFEMHVLQDQEALNLLENIFLHKSINYPQYMTNCAMLDYYFLTKNNSYIFNNFLDKFNFKQVCDCIDINNLTKSMDIPEDILDLSPSLILDKQYDSINKDHLIICDDLLKKTYHSLGLIISSSDIHEQAANIVGSFLIAAIIAGKQELPLETMSKIESECDKLSKLCITNLKFIDNDTSIL